MVSVSFLFCGLLCIHTRSPSPCCSLGRAAAFRTFYRVNWSSSLRQEQGHSVTRVVTFLPCMCIIHTKPGACRLDSWLSSSHILSIRVYGWACIGPSSPSSFVLTRLYVRARPTHRVMCVCFYSIWRLFALLFPFSLPTPPPPLS